MAFHNWLLIHHNDGRHGGEMHSGRRGHGVRGSPCVTPRQHMTKSASSEMTWSSQLCLIWSGNRLVGLRSLGSMYDISKVT